MEKTWRKDHHARPKHIRQKAKPVLWIKDTNLRSHYEFTSCWTTLKFVATMQANSKKPSR